MFCFVFSTQHQSSSGQYDLKCIENQMESSRQLWKVSDVVRQSCRLNISDYWVNWVVYAVKWTETCRQSCILSSNEQNECRQLGHIYKLKHHEVLSDIFRDWQGCMFAYDGGIMVVCIPLFYIKKNKMENFWPVFEVLKPAISD